MKRISEEQGGGQDQVIAGTDARSIERMRPTG